MTWAKFLTSLSVFAVTFIVTLCFFALGLTLWYPGHELVVLRTLVVAGRRVLTYPSVDIAGTMKVLFSFREMYGVITRLGILSAVPFALGAIVWMILSGLAGRLLRSYFNRKTTLHGSSRWATDREMKEAGLMGNNGLVLGQTGDAKYVRSRKGGYSLSSPGDLLLQNSAAHTLIVGSTRSGKGVSTIIPTEFMWKDSLIVFDPKAEGWDISASFRSKFSYTFKFQPEHPSESIHYNPLLAIRRGTQTISDIQNLSHILIPDNPQAKDPFWDNEGRKMLSAVIGYVIYCEPPENKTFRYVYSLFTMVENLDGEENKPAGPADMEGDIAEGRESQRIDEDTKRLTGGQNVSLIKQFLIKYSKNCKEYMEKMPEMPSDIYRRFSGRYGKDVSRAEREKIEEEARPYLTKEDKETLDSIYRDLIYFSQSPDQQLASVVSSMTTQLQVIADPNVQAITDRSDFLMEDFMDGITDENGQTHPLSLYLCVSLESMSRLIPLMRIIYEQAIRLLTRDLRKRQYRLLLIFDEFYQMGNMEIVNKALALSAGYGVYCCIAIQSYDQLRQVYRSETQFIDNFAYQVILRVSSIQTCETIEKILGKETKKHVKVNSSGNLGQLTHRHESYDTQELGRSLMTAEEVRTMEENECIIIMAGEHPYRAKKVRYYLDDRFRRLYIDPKTDRPFPPPPIEENYPHPEIMTFDEKGRITENPGLDRNGWHLLAGHKATVEAEKEEETRRYTEDPVIRRAEETGDDGERNIIDGEPAGKPVRKESPVVYTKDIIPDRELDEGTVAGNEQVSEFLEYIRKRAGKYGGGFSGAHTADISEEIASTREYMGTAEKEFRMRESGLGLTGYGSGDLDFAVWDSPIKTGTQSWAGKGLYRFYEEDQAGA